MVTPSTGSFHRDPHALLATNPVGLVPLGWERDTSELATVARLGYEGVQVDGDEPDGWVDALASHSLRPSEVYLAIPCDVAGPTAEAEVVVDERIKYAMGVGAENLVLAVDGNSVRDRVTAHATEGPCLEEEGWERLVALTDAIGRRVSDTGMAVSFHPHAGTWVETPTEIAQLLSRATSLDLCLDTGHHLVGGGDPVDAIGEYGDRLRHVHVKDVDPDILHRLATTKIGGFTEAIGERVFCPLGSGILDLSGVVTALHELGYDGWLMVEQDSMWEPPVESSAISRRILEWTCRAQRKTRQQSSNRGD